MLTRLEAVNKILSSVGYTVVSQLDVGNTDSDNAETVLDDVVREIQAKGWHVNTEENIELSLNVDNEIVLGTNVLSVDTSREDKAINVVARNGKLYNLTDRTYIFTANVKVDIIYELTWDELTFELQNYITFAAARRYQQNYIKNDRLDRKLEARENKAYSELISKESKNSEASLRNSPAISRMIYRNGRR